MTDHDLDARPGHDHHDEGRSQEPTDGAEARHEYGHDVDEAEAHVDAPEAAHAEGDARRAERRARSDERRAERDTRREERRRQGWGGFLGETFGERIREEIGRGLGDSAALGDRIREEIGRGLPGRDEEPGQRSHEVIEHRFVVDGMPRVSVRNVSGETRVSVGAEGEVRAQARKRVHGWSEERAKRLLENVEIRFEQNGNDILIEPRLYEQERGWLDLFRGGRVAVDLDVRVPREARIDATTVSGDLSVSGTRGPTELRSVSGAVSIEDVQGPMRLRTVSGAIDAREYAGQLEANSVSGEVRFERSRCRAPDVVTVSGDVELDGVSAAGDDAEGRVKTVSGDVELSFCELDVDVDFRTTSGDAELEGPGRLEKLGRRDRRIVIGRGAGHLKVHTVSGDLCCRSSRAGAGAPAPSSAALGSIPKAETAAPSAAARDVLDRVARGEMTVEEAAAALDAARGG